jgi:hypothetical protein
MQADARNKLSNNRSMPSEHLQLPTNLEGDEKLQRLDFY